MKETFTSQMEHIEARITDLVIRLTILGFFVYWSLALIRPFLPIVVWAVVLAVALSPFHNYLSARFGGRRGIASVIVTVVALTVVIGPVAVLARSLVETVQDIVARSSSGAFLVPNPPEFLSAWPVMGPRIESFWVLATTNTEEIFVRYSDLLSPVRDTLISGLSSVSFDLLKFIFSIVVSGVLLVPGPRLATGARRIASRIIAPRGEEFVDLAGHTIRNVSRGVIGVSLLQAIPIGIVFEIIGLPSAGMLAFLVLLLCVLQVGPALVVLPVLVWAWMTLSTGQALFLTAVLVPLTIMDNVLKPLFIGSGMKTPVVVIFLGVVGGAISYGLIGLFLGPIILAVFYDLVLTWTLFGKSKSDEPQQMDRPV